MLDWFCTVYCGAKYSGEGEFDFCSRYICGDTGWEQADCDFEPSEYACRVCLGRGGVAVASDYVCLVGYGYYGGYGGEAD